MEWDRDTAKYTIVALSGDNALLEEMAGFFSEAENVRLIDLSAMEKDAADRFIAGCEIDIAYIEDEFIRDRRDGPVGRIAEKAIARGDGPTTHFVLRYDGRCYKRVRDFGEELLKEKLPLTVSRVDEEGDYIILCQTIQGIVMGREQRKRAWSHELGEYLSD